MSGERLMPEPGPAETEGTTRVPPIDTSGIGARAGEAHPPIIPLGVRRAIEQQYGTGLSEDEMRGILRAHERQAEAQAEEGEGERRMTRKKLEPDEYYVYINNPQLGYEIGVPWKKTREAQEKHIKEVLGRIEISKSDITQQMQVDYQNALSVLEVLEVQNGGKNPVTKEDLTPDQIKEQQSWAKKMRFEMKARIDFHKAFLAYESGGSVKEVADAMSKIPSAWLDIIFEFQEKIPGTEETFNPFVEAIQYYEDHGHEFARNNIAKGRERFGDKVQKYLTDFVARKSLGIDPNTDIESLPDEIKGNYKTFIKDKEKEYAWAQNMAERLFRSTGRAIMYDYLVVNKDGKDKNGDPAEERMVDIHYKPLNNENVEWAGGRDTCDYPMSKILRFRENLATSSESKLMRPHLELMDGVDIFGGDFWSRTVRGSNVKNGSGVLVTYRLPREAFEVKVAKKVEELINQDGVARGDAEGIARRLLLKKYFPVDRPVSTDPRANEYYKADVYADRDDVDNTGEMVGRIDFRQMERKKTKNGDLEAGVEFSGIEFEENSGDSPWGIWTVRRLGGAEEAKKGLTENSASFLLNPNFESLSKLISTFDATKDNAWKVKEQLLKNFIKYARGKDIEGTGKPRLSEDEILAGVNKLTGLTDPNAPQFVQMPERQAILKNYFNIEISPEETERIKQEAMELARLEVLNKYAGLNKSKEEIDAEIKNNAEKRINKMTNAALNNQIENRTDTNLAKSFGGNLVLGFLEKSLKQVLAELGVK